MEVSVKKSLYIRGLQAAYSGVLEVIDDAFHVAAYRYFPDRSKWERMDIEGSAYVTRNSSIPLYSLIVLNKKGAADLILHVEENIEKVQVQDQYIMLRCRNDDGKVILGLWIHDKTDRDRFFGSIVRTKNIRKNSPDMTSLLGKYVIRNKSPQTVQPTTEKESKLSFSSILQEPSSSRTSGSNNASSALTASISAANSALSDASPAAAVDGKTSALLSLLKNPVAATQPQPSAAPVAATKGTLSVSPASSGIASLEDIIKKPETAAATVGSNIQASAKLLSLLSGAKAASSDASTNALFPTDSQISARAKSQSSATSSPLMKPIQPSSSLLEVSNNSLPPPLPPSVALKAALSLPVTATSSVDVSPLATPFPRSADVPSVSSNVTSLAASPPASATINFTNSAKLLAAVSPSVTSPSVSSSNASTPGIKIMTADKALSLFTASPSQVPLRAMSAPTTSNASGASISVPPQSTKKVAKLISPSDFGEMY